MLALTVALVVSCNNGPQDPPKEQVDTWLWDVLLVYNESEKSLSEQPLCPGHRKKMEEFFKHAKASVRTAAGLVRQSQNISQLIKNDAELRRFVKNAARFWVNFCDALASTPKIKKSRFFDVYEHYTAMEPYMSSQDEYRLSSMICDLDGLLWLTMSTLATRGTHSEGGGTVEEYSRIEEFYEKMQAHKDSIGVLYETFASKFHDALLVWESLLEKTITNKGSTHTSCLIEDTEAGRKKFIDATVELVVSCTEALKETHKEFFNLPGTST